MHQEAIQVPEKGTYKWQLFNYWSDEYRQTRADHSAYIALNFAGALDACRSKLQTLVQRHSQAGSNASTRARHRSPAKHHDGRRHVVRKLFSPLSVLQLWPTTRNTSCA